MVTFHIRKRIRPKGGRPFYRDYTPRTTSTLCGAAVTSFDILIYEKAQAWGRKSDGEQFRPCADCVEEKIK